GHGHSSWTAAHYRNVHTNRLQRHFICGRNRQARMTPTTTAGFTLVELLVAMALLSIMLVALGAVESSTMKASNEITGEASRLQALQDAAGYVGDRVRAASVLSTSLSVNGSACDLTPAAGNLPCFAVLVGEVRQIGANAQYDANAYLYLVYRLVARTQLASADRTPSTWADANTYALVESRQLVCAPNAAAPVLPCAATTVTGVSTAIPTSIPTSITTTATNVLMDYATLDQNPGTFTAFSNTASTTSAPGQLVLRFRQKQQQRGQTIYTPRSGPFELTVQRRN
ncbi:MAG: prepilin-type N-terminal cleavage/methylation protein, partial [Deinococcus sp.]|nr:prepilin-type N-terminal cleavage/methylation protein [Deinococcus sp.]